MSDKQPLCSGLDDYQIETWISTLESIPIRVIKNRDESESYTMDRAYVLKLENGRFALVTESGCSCYSASDANIELFPSENRAIEAFNRYWKNRT